MPRLLLVIGVIAAGLAALIFALPVPEPDRPTATSDGALMLTGVTVFDGAAFRPDQSVLIEDARITAVGRDLAAPPGAQLIDGAGLTALPGLIDAHTHTWGEGLTDALRFGVTTHLDMFTAPGQLARARADRTDPSVHDRADMLSAGMLATVEGGHGTQFGVPVETLSTPADAPGWVEAREAEGSDFIKLVYMPDSPVFPSLDLITARAVIDAAHARGLTAVAHVDTLKGARDMVEAGVDGLVHVFADAPVDAAFIEAARERDVFVIPTLAVLASLAGGDAGASFAADPRVSEHLSPAQRRGLAGGFGMPPTPRYQYPLAAANVAALHQAGLTILAGSDAPNPGAAYGASLHHELQLLTGAGLTPGEALHAATLAPARVFALEDRGRITPGARADLVLVEGDPGADITSTLSIAAVIRNGALTERGDAGLESAGPAAGARPQTLDIGVFDGVTNGFAWTETTDAVAGGSSTAALTTAGGVLRTEFTIASGFTFPWAGPSYFPAGAEARPLDVSGLVLTLRLRAAPGDYRVMMFNVSQAGSPPARAIRLDETWRTVRVGMDAVSGLDSSALLGFAVVGGPAPGDGWIEIDAARFEPVQ